MAYTDSASKIYRHSRRADLEEMRLSIEEEMIRLEKNELRRRRRQIQQNQMKINGSALGTSTSATSSATSSVHCSMNDNSANGCCGEKCQTCSRKDQIIQEKLEEIRLLRNQLITLKNNSNKRILPRKGEKRATPPIIPEQDSQPYSSRSSSTSVDSPQTDTNLPYKNLLQEASVPPIKEVICDDSSIASDLTFRLFS